METKSKKQKQSSLTEMLRRIFILVPILDKTQGFLTKLEGSLLYAYALNNLSGEIVEIGSFKGKSTIWLAQGLADSNKKGFIYAIDHHKGSKEHQINKRFENGPTLVEFKKNILNSGLSNLIKPLVMDSMTAVKNWNKKIGLLFIDGSHDYEDIRKDFIEWSKFVRKGGVIIFHDTELWEGPKAVVNEFINGSEKYISFKIHSMTVAQKL